MNNNTIKSILIKSIDLKNIYVTGDNNHIEIIAIGDIFLNMSKVKRQQTIYLPLMQYFSNQLIHAISIKTYTTTEWIKQKNKI
ncbi:MAG: BolA family protein [Buchnera aphidicola (Eriosoma harunire)]